MAKGDQFKGDNRAYLNVNPGEESWSDRVEYYLKILTGKEIAPADKATITTDSAAFGKSTDATADAAVLSVNPSQPYSSIQLFKAMLLAQDTVEPKLASLISLLNTVSGNVDGVESLLLTGNTITNAANVNLTSIKTTNEAANVNLASIKTINEVANVNLASIKTSNEAILARLNAGITTSGSSGGGGAGMEENVILTATSNQTVFTLIALPPTPTKTKLFINGVKYELLEDYTLSSYTLTWLGAGLKSDARLHFYY